MRDALPPPISTIRRSRLKPRHVHIHTPVWILVFLILALVRVVVVALSSRTRPGPQRAPTPRSSSGRTSIRGGVSVDVSRAVCRGRNGGEVGRVGVLVLTEGRDGERGAAGRVEGDGVVAAEGGTAGGGRGKQSWRELEDRPAGSLGALGG
jgi:uncharacterized membrane protein YgcG